MEDRWFNSFYQVTKFETGQNWKYLQMTIQVYKYENGLVKDRKQCG